jgi:glycosyltransferase involved in cell wall biosynthesis
MNRTAPTRPLVSVGLPVYNGEQYLTEAIGSVLAQDHDNVEVLLSDNASTDGTEAIGRRFARLDGRVRYFRNAENVGSRRNFDFVLSQAKGKYFTWVAHDDVLNDPSYLRAACDALEASPDAVLCGCSMNVLDHEGPGTSAPALLEPIYPDRDWAEARKRFFRCPYDSLIYFAIYGVYRRDVLRQVPMRERWYKGRRVSLDLENPILAEVAVRGRIIALPELLRSYRQNDRSSWHQDMDRLTAWDKFVLGVGMKGTILGIALAAPLPFRARLGLAGVALGNFFRHVFGPPTDYKAQLKALRKQIRTLQRDCDERLDIIRRLEAERAAARSAAGPTGEEDPAAWARARDEVRAMLAGRPELLAWFEREMARAAPGPRHPLRAVAGRMMRKMRSLRDGWRKAA